MLPSKNQEKKMLKKQLRAQHAITADTQIECSNQASENLVICNAGLATGLQQDALLGAAAPFGAVRDCIMLPGKSYCFLRCCTANDALRIFAGLHGATNLAQNAGVLYVSYCAGVPTVPSTWDGPLPPGLQLIENFVSSDEEQQLLADCCSNAIVSTLKHRHVQHFGYEFLYGTNTVDRTAPLLDRPIPATCSPLWSRMEAYADCTAFRPDQLTVNAYAPGHGIPPHVDTHSPFADPIVSLSLGAGVVMDFRQPATGVQRSVWLPARSLLVMRGEARYGWTHGITPRHMDVVPIVNGEAENAAVGLTVRTRTAQRVSLTFRQLTDGRPCECRFSELCDSRQTRAMLDNGAANDVSPPNAAALELSNVHSVYDTIAGHFSETRHSPWPLVQQFVRQLGVGAVLADIGCGNGKYLVDASAAGRLRLGGDRSTGLLAVCRDRGLNVFRCDCLQVPLRDGSADGCICIAVVHHLATEDRRLQALGEIARILRPGGQALVYVWAKNQAQNSQQSSYLRQNKHNRCSDSTGTTIDRQHSPVVEYVNGLPVHTNRTQFAAQDMLVPWKMRAEPDDATKATAKPQQLFLRYYHVFEEGELEALVGRVNGVHVLRSYYDQGNWCVVFEKTSITDPETI